MSKRLDLAGQKFGRLTVLGHSHIKNNASYSLCRCDCGNEIICKNKYLKNSDTQSCGCYKLESSLDNVVKAHKKLRPKYVENTSLLLIKSNRKANKNNKLGILGVTYYEKWGKHTAHINFKGETIYLGSYKNIREAITAREKAEEKYFKPILEKYEMVKI